MKKITKILSVLLMVAVVALTFAACGGSGGVAGRTFVLDKDATDVSGVEGGELVLAMFKEFSITFNKDNTCKITATVSLLGDSQTEDVDGTYEQDDNKVTIKENESKKTIECTIDGGKLLMEQEGVKLVFSPK